MESTILRSLKWGKIHLVLISILAMRHPWIKTHTPDSYRDGRIKKSYRHMKQCTLIIISAILLLISCNTKEKKTQDSLPEDAPRPNIIFLLTDDQRWDALGAMGNDIIQTPNLDNLANDGVLFTNANVTTSICVASRASILTGQYVLRHGINSFHDTLQGKKLENSYPLLLKKNADYKIGFIGKYGIGLGQPKQHFDYWAAEKMHQPNYENEGENGDFIHYTDLVGNRMDEFLDQFGQGEQPFCLSVSFKAPHCQDVDPRQFIYQDKYKDLYADIEIPLPETAGDEYYDFYPEDFKHPIHPTKDKIIENEARRRWGIRFPDAEKYQETVRSYYRLITGVDDCVAGLVKKLETLGVADNTIIVFMGDNGFYLGEHAMAGKWFPHQEAIKVPFFVYDPRLEKEKRGQKIDDFTFNIDIAPTLLSLANVPIPKTMQGMNAMSLLDENKVIRNDFFYEHNLDIPTIPKSEALVSKQSKYIVYHELNPVYEEFYDLENDPKEKVNRIDDPAYKDEIKRAKTRFQELKECAK